MKIVSIEELINSVGTEQGTGEWFVLDQQHIDQFAEVTHDHQFIHVNEEAAKPIFGGTIAHGFLTLSLLTTLSTTIEGSLIPQGITMGMNYGFDKVRFLQPVKRGSKVRASSKLAAVTQKSPTNILCKSEFTIEIEGETKPALVAEWLTMYMVAPQS